MTVVEFPAHVLIGATAIAETYSEASSAPVGIASIEFDWGRERVTEKVQPHTAKIEIIDPSGSWAANPARQGERVVISTLTGAYKPRVLFRGGVSQVTQTRAYLAQSQGGRRAVWRVTITAQDVLGQLAQDTIVGPGLGGVVGVGGWEDNAVNYIMKQVFAAGLNRYLDAIPTSTDLMTASAMDAPLNGRDTPYFQVMEASSSASLLDHLQRLAAVQPFAGINYVPDTNTVEPWPFPGWGAGAVTLTRDRAGKLDLTFAGAGKIVDASRLVVSKDLTVTATTSQSFDTSRIEFQHLGFDDQGKTKTYQLADQRNIARENQTVSRRSYVQSTPFIRYENGFRNYGVNSSGIKDYGANFIQALIAATALAVERINDYSRLPELEYHAERPGASVAEHDLFMSTWAQNVAIYLRRSVLAGMVSVPTVVQIIGGKMRYDETGWKHSLYFSPASNPHEPRRTPDMTVDAAFAKTSATVDDLGDNLTFGDLESAEKGLTA